MPLFLFGFLVGLMQITHVSGTTSTYSGSLTSSSPVFSPSARPTGRYYLQAFRITVSAGGSYSITSSSTIDTYGYLYTDPFYGSNPNINLITSDDDSAGNRQFRLTSTLLSSGTYVLIVSTYELQVTGSFSINIDGPGSASAVSFIPSGLSSTSTSRSSASAGIYTGYLSSSSKIFYRPNGVSSSYYRYEALQISVYQSGTYTFTSDSSLDTYGYLYSGSVDPSYPSANLVSSDDDSGGNRQFQISYYLQAGQNYVLIATTYSANTYGSFSVRATGPYLVSMYSFTPSTSRPITTTYSYYSSYKLSSTVIVIISSTVGLFVFIVFISIVAAAAKSKQRTNPMIRAGVQAQPYPMNGYNQNRIRVAYVSGAAPPNVHTVEEQPPAYDYINKYPKV